LPSKPKAYQVRAAVSRVVRHFQQHVQELDHRTRRDRSRPCPAKAFWPMGQRLSVRGRPYRAKEAAGRRHRAFPAARRPKRRFDLPTPTECEWQERCNPSVARLPTVTGRPTARAPMSWPEARTPPEIAMSQPPPDPQSDRLPTVWRRHVAVGCRRRDPQASPLVRVREKVQEAAP